MITEQITINRFIFYILYQKYLKHYLFIENQHVSTCVNNTLEHI